MNARRVQVFFHEKILSNCRIGFPLRWLITQLIVWASSFRSIRTVRCHKSLALIFSIWNRSVNCPMTSSATLVEIYYEWQITVPINRVVSGSRNKIRASSFSDSNVVFWLWSIWSIRRINLLNSWFIFFRCDSNAANVAESTASPACCAAKFVAAF